MGNVAKYPSYVSTGSSGVASVTDDGNGYVSVDNADPANPVITFSGNFETFEEYTIDTTDGVAVEVDLGDYSEFVNYVFWMEVVGLVKCTGGELGTPNDCQVFLGNFAFKVQDEIQPLNNDGSNWGQITFENADSSMESEFGQIEATVSFQSPYGLVIEVIGKDQFELRWHFKVRKWGKEI